MKTPETIASMAELRTEIDALDARLVALLATRARLIERAAQIKQGAGLPARIDARVEEVVAHVRAVAQREGLDPAQAEALWRQIIEWAITREEQVLGKGEGA
ncbi:chorismate mutase [Pontitalea aquivivens]|uniref:chorismate mutase n=1 Tax=Pontitalea aquivivens TaxID=3388663 RepID=UPI003970717F